MIKTQFREKCRDLDSNTELSFVVSVLVVFIDVDSFKACYAITNSAGYHKSD